MALLPKRSAFPTQNPTVANQPAAPSVSPGAASAAPATPAQSPTANAESNDPFKVTENAEKGLVDILRSAETREAIERVNPKMTDKAINAAIAYVTDRSAPESWAAIVTAKPKSVVDAVVKLAASNLIVSQLSGEAFLVPRFSKVERSNIVVPIPGVRGMEKKIFESGKVASIDGNVVRAQDHFIANEGLNPSLEFRRNIRPDPTKPNPVIGAYVVITSSENRPAKIKTVAIEEVTFGEGAKKGVAWKANGEQLNTGRMGIEAAGVYSVQRPGMREVIRTWMQNNAELNSLMEMEDASMRVGEEIHGAQPRIRSGSRQAPAVIPSAVADIPASAAVSVSPHEQTNGHAKDADKLLPAVNASAAPVQETPAPSDQPTRRATGPRML